MRNWGALIDETFGVAKKNSSLVEASRSRVYFSLNDQTIVFDLALPFHRVCCLDLETRLLRLPILVRFDRGSRLVKELYFAEKYWVKSYKPRNGQFVDVILEPSHATHYLRKRAPRFSESLSIVKEAIEKGRPLYIISDRDTREIKRVHMASGELPFATEQVEETPFSGPEVSLSAASAAFGKVRSASDIPFSYPDNGCWGRAHAMYRIMLDEGITASKIWHYGNLVVHTPNNPSCKVLWRWHVAPIVAIENQAEPLVIDPALFSEPVTVRAWREVQGDANSNTLLSSGLVFYRFTNGTTATDPDFSKTKQVLQHFREELLLRSVEHGGPPPYSNCF